MWSELGLCAKCALLGSNPSEAFFREGDIAVACRRTAIAAGVAFFATGFIAHLFPSCNIIWYRISTFSSSSYNTQYPVPINTDITITTANPFLIDGISIVLNNNVLLNDQDGTTADVTNGVYTLINISGNDYQFQRSTIIMPVDASSNAAYISVAEGTVNALSGWVQTYELEPNTVGTTPLIFSKYFSFAFKLGQGLYPTQQDGQIYVNVDSSLNFINYIDGSNNDTINIGTNTNNINIGSSTANIQFNNDVLINTLTVGLGGGLGGGNDPTNTAVGYQALQSNTNGGLNTAIGYQALKANANNGTENTAIGSTALYFNIGGAYNTAIGSTSLYSNTSGTENTAIGVEALNSNQDGYENTAIGSTSLYLNTSGYQNTAIGKDALYSKTSGFGNTSFGYRSGYHDTSGNFNTFLGYQATCNPYVIYNNSTALGSYATIDASNQIVLGTSNEKVKIPGTYVGIGVYNPSPDYVLDISGNVNISSAESQLTIKSTDNSSSFILANGINSNLTAGNFGITNSNKPANIPFVVTDTGSVCINYTNRTWNLTSTPPALQVNNSIYITDGSNNGIPYASTIYQDGSAFAIQNSYPNGYVYISSTGGGLTIDGNGMTTVQGASGPVLRLQNNLPVYNSGNVNIEFWTAATPLPSTRPAAPLGYISTTDLSQGSDPVGGVYQSSMSFNVNYNTNFVGMTLTGVSDGTLYGGTANLDVSGNIYANNSLILSYSSVIYQNSSTFTLKNNNNDVITIDGTGYVTIDHGTQVDALTVNNGTTCTGILTANGGITTGPGTGITSAGVITANYGITVSGGSGIQLTGLINASDFITAGTTITAGTGLTVTSGGASITGGIQSFQAINTNGLTVNSPGLSVTSGGASITGTTDYLDLSSNPMPAGLIIKTTTGTGRLLMGAYYTGGLGFATALQSSDYYTDDGASSPTDHFGSTLYLNPQGGNVNAINFVSTSDYRIKQNVETLDSRYTTDNLRPVTYLNKKLGKQDIGLIAHELQEIYPELVNGVKDGEEMQSVNYIALIPILIKEIQELKKEIKSVKIELNELKNK